MNIPPIFDVSNIPNKNYGVIFPDKLTNDRNYNYNVTGAIQDQLLRVFKLNNKYFYKNDEDIYFIHFYTNYTKINYYYKLCYNNDYIDISSELYDKFNKDFIFLVIQKGIPLQIFIPEDKYTYIEEYKNIVLTIDNINKLNKKIIKFSLYYQKESLIYKNLMKRVAEYKTICVIRTYLKDVFIIDFVNLLSIYMYLLLQKHHLLDYDKMINTYSRKFNNVMYGYAFGHYYF